MDAELVIACYRPTRPELGGLQTAKPRHTLRRRRIYQRGGSPQEAELTCRPVPISAMAANRRLVSLERAAILCYHCAANSDG